MIEACRFGRSLTSLRNFWDGSEGLIFLASCAHGDVWNIRMCRAFVLALNTLFLAVLLVGRVLVVPSLILSTLGRRCGAKVVPLAASFASTLASSSPGIPEWPGVHCMIILFTSMVCSAAISVWWKWSMR